MKRAALKALSLAAALTLSARLACAAVPQYINYQGKLGDASGNPLTGTYSFQFTFYDAASGGNQLFQEQWTGTSNAVGVVNGIYSVQIGSLTVGGIPASTFDGSSVYLEIAVNLGTSLSGAETLSPRERLAASVYSIHSRTAEYLGTGVDIATFTSVGYLLVPVGLSIGTSSTTSVLAVVSTYTYAASTTSLVNLSPIGLNTNSLAKPTITGVTVKPEMSANGSAHSMFYGLNASPVIDPVGSASNVIYGLYSAPTINDSLGPSSGHVGYSLYVNAPTFTGSTGTGYAAVFQGGNVGIGTDAPAHTLDVVGSYYSRLVNDGNSGASVTIDWNSGNVQFVTLTANTTLTFSNGESGARYVLALKQDSTGGRTVTWPASVRWSGGTAPTLTTTASKTDYVGFIYNGVDSKYDGVAFNGNF